MTHRTLAYGFLVIAWGIPLAVASLSALAERCTKRPVPDKPRGHDDYYGPLS